MLGTIYCIRNVLGNARTYKEDTALFLPKPEMKPMVCSPLGHEKFTDKFWDNDKCSEIVGNILSVYDFITVLRES